MHINKSLVFSFTWLSASQGANFVIPLIVYPYLLRVVDVERFGLIVFAQAVVTYFVYIVDYGFSITAVRAVSLYRKNPSKLSYIFSKLYLTKFLLLIICLALFSTLVSLIPEWRSERFLFLSSFTIVLGQLLLPVWFFQGIENMKNVAIMNFATKGVFAALIIILINNPQDYIWANALLGVSQISIALLALTLIVIRYKLKVTGVSMDTVKDQLKENRSLFFSGFSVFIANNSNLMILGLIADPVSIGYYGIIDKILLAIRTPAVMLYQTVFPRVCALATGSFKQVKKFLKNVNAIVYALFIPLGLTIFIFSDQIVYLFAGDYISEVSTLLQIVCFVPFFAAINISPTHTFLAYDLKRSYAKITAISAFLNIILNIVLASTLSSLGTAIAVIITEIFIASALYIYLGVSHKECSIQSVLNPL